MGTRERRDREKQARRQTILASAKEIFFEKGLVHATMDEIAEKAELSKGTLYLYFPSKEDLYISLAVEGIEILLERFEEVASRDLPPDVLLLEIGEAYYRFYEDYQDYFKILFFLEHRDTHMKISPELIIEANMKGAKCLEITAAAIQRGMDQGVFRKDLVPMQIATILWTTSNGIIQFLHNHRGCDPDFEKRLDIRFDDLLHKSWELTISAIRSGNVEKKAMPVS